jgi:hypothetical protein
MLSSAQKAVVRRNSVIQLQGRAIGLGPAKSVFFRFTRLTLSAMWLSEGRSGDRRRRSCPMMGGL